ncbi:MAG: PIN domain-containing protein [Bacillota bacterium]
MKRGLVYLLDTNIFLEILLQQEHTAAAKAIFKTIHPSRLYISDFSVHSIGVLLFRRNQHEVYNRFVEDMILNCGTVVLRLNA